jgi:hypothetical protein
MDLDKWQQREAREFAAEHGVSYEEAVAELFPDVPAESAPAAEPASAEGAAEGEPKSLTKSAPTK